MGVVLEEADRVIVIVTVKTFELFVLSTVIALEPTFKAIEEDGSPEVTSAPSTVIELVLSVAVGVKEIVAFEVEIEYEVPQLLNAGDKVPSEAVIPEKVASTTVSDVVVAVSQPSEFLFTIVP